MSIDIPSEVQINIVGESVRTSLPPVVDSSFKTKTVVLIRTSDYKGDAIDLLQAYSQFQVKAIIEHLSSSLNFAELECELRGIVEQYKHLSPIVNVSNGSKLQSIALYKVSKELGLSVFSVNSNDTISWLCPDKKTVVEIEDRVKIPNFLGANGFHYLGDFTPGGNQELSELLWWMVNNLEEFIKAISQLNYYAYSANEQRISKPLQGNLKQLEILISQFSLAKLAEIKNNRIHFLNEEVRFFANGGWLEEFIHHQLADLKHECSELQDFRSSVKLSSKSHNVKNEIDNMILFNNQLFLIECKTKKFTDRGHPEGGAMDTLYKMDTLMSELGGPIAKGMVVSVYPFSIAEIKRAKQYDIELVSFDEIRYIKNRLKSWFNQ